jgi:hypothetical protein
MDSKHPHLIYTQTFFHDMKTSSWRQAYNGNFKPKRMTVKLITIETSAPQPIVVQASFIPDQILFSYMLASSNSVDINFNIPDNVDIRTNVPTFQTLGNNAGILENIPDGTLSNDLFFTIEFSD